MRFLTWRGRSEFNEPIEMSFTRQGPIYSDFSVSHLQYICLLLGYWLGQQVQRSTARFSARLVVHFPNSNCGCRWTRLGKSCRTIDLPLKFAHNGLECGLCGKWLTRFPHLDEHKHCSRHSSNRNITGNSQLAKQIPPGTCHLSWLWFTAGKKKKRIKAAGLSG